MIAMQWSKATWGLKRIETQDQWDKWLYNNRTIIKAIKMILKLRRKK